MIRHSTPSKMRIRRFETNFPIESDNDLETPMTTTQPTPKRRNLARRPRLNPDWPIYIYKWDCWPVTHDGQIQKMPDALWKTAKLMQSLWNDYCALFQKVGDLDKKTEDGIPLLAKEERAALWFWITNAKTERTEQNAERYDLAVQLWGDVLPSLRAIAQAKYKGLLSSHCYEAVINKFIVTVKQWKKNPAIFGPPKTQYVLSKIKIPIFYYEGKNAAWLSSARNSERAQAWFIPTEEGKAWKLEHKDKWQINGWFDIGIDERTRINLHVALHRQLPEIGRIKAVSLCGQHNKPFGWAWSLQVQYESPKEKAFVATNRVAGLDLGWRNMGTYLRIGMLKLSNGQSIELQLPFEFADYGERRFVQRLKKQGCESRVITNWLEIPVFQAKEDAVKDKCKAQLKALPVEVTATWPVQTANRLKGLTKMGSQGLWRLLSELREANIEDAGRAALEEWQHDSTPLRRAIRKAQLRTETFRLDHYRKIAKWLATNFDVVAWEGDLSLKQMAEKSGGDAIDEAQKYRMIASLHLLRQCIKQAMQKAGRQLTGLPASYSSSQCAKCGGWIDHQGKLLVVCENGHKWDQDVNSSTLFINELEGQASMSPAVVIIPDELKRCLRAVPLIAATHGG